MTQNRIFPDVALDEVLDAWPQPDSPEGLADRIFANAVIIPDEAPPHDGMASMDVRETDRMARWKLPARRRMGYAVAGSGVAVAILSVILMNQSGIQTRQSPPMESNSQIPIIASANPAEQDGLERESLDQIAQQTANAQTSSDVVSRAETRLKPPATERARATAEPGTRENPTGGNVPQIPAAGEAVAEAPEFRAPAEAMDNIELVGPMNSTNGVLNDELRVSPIGPPAPTGRAFNGSTTEGIGSQTFPGTDGKRARAPKPHRAPYF